MRSPQQNMTLVIVWECAVLWAFQISKRASLLQHRFRLSFDRAGKGSPCHMAQNHVPAASLRLPCWYQNRAYRVDGVIFMSCSPYIDINRCHIWILGHVTGLSDLSDQGICPRSIPGFLDVIWYWEFCTLPQFFAFWFDYKQPHFQNGDSSISVFQCFLWGHAHYLPAPCDTEKVLQRHNWQWGT